MKRIWLALVVEYLILILLKPLITDFDAAALIAVLIHVVFSMIVLMTYKDKFVFLGAYFARLAFLFWDLYFSHIFVLPNSGADTGMFYRQSVYFSENLSRIMNESGGIYSKLAGFLQYFIGPQRMFIQYINILFGLSIVFLVYKMLLILEVKENIIKVTTLIAAFFPNSLVMSAIFLREIIPTFFVAASLYFFVKWFKGIGSQANIILTLLMLGLGSMFHSGVIGVAVGYVFMFLFYKKETKKFAFSANTILSFFLILLVAWPTMTFIGDKILYKFQAVDKIEDIFATANTRLGGSAYLTSLTITNPIQFVLYTPIKIFYFFTAPLPWSWRGPMDLFTFFTDTTLYLGSLFLYFKNKSRNNVHSKLALGLVVMIIGAGIIFGTGVGNAGTAVRHRQKLVSLFLILLSLGFDEKNYRSIDGKTT